MTLVDTVARAIARNKRGALATDADIDRAYTAYIGQARAAIAAVFDWLAEPVSEHEWALGPFLYDDYEMFAAILADKRKQALGVNNPLDT